MVGAGQRVFATRDSLTMISEVIAAKGQVEVVRPRTSLLKPDTVYERYLNRLENEGLLVSHRIHSLPESDQTMSSVSIRERQAVFEEELVARIKALVTH